MSFKPKEAVIASVGTTSDTAFAANPGRRYLSITNTHASQDLYVRFGTTAATAALGVKIAAGATSVWGLYNGSAVPGSAVQVLGSGSATTFYGVEGDGDQVS